MSLACFHSFLLTTFSWVWRTSMATAVLIGLVLLVQAVWGKRLPPRWRYALWLLVGLRMLMPAVPHSRLSIFNLDDRLCFRTPFGSSASLVLPPAQGRSEESAAPLHPKGEEAQFSASSAPRSSRREEAHFSAQRDQSLLTSAATVQGWPPVSSATSAWLDHVGTHFLASVPALWLMGAAGYLFVVLVQHHRFSSRMKVQKPVRCARVMAVLEDAKGILALRRTIPVVEATAQNAPAVFGVIHPRLLLSRATVEQLSDTELRLVILHELVHVQRGDALLNWLVILLQALHWFNPLVWLAMRRLRADRELVCDAAVMRHLTHDERRAYGNTLIKMLGSFSPAPLVPSLLPILGHKHEIHRRITMIAQFKPTTRFVTLASGLLLLTLGCLTFTTAAEKPSAPAVEKPKEVPELEKQREAPQHALKILEEELAKRGEQVKEMQQKLDALKEDLGISESEDAPQPRPASELDPLGRLEGIRLVAFEDFVQIDTIYYQLTNLSRGDLRKAILTISPDIPLSELIKNKAVVEQDLAKVSETYGSDHPEVKRLRVALKTTKEQIEERMDGILLGLKAKRDAQKDRLETLQAEIEKTRKVALQRASQRRPYFQAKRDLETVQYMRDKLMMRIMQEKIDAAMPKQP